MFMTSKHSTIKGTVHVPGSKSHTIRAILLAAMSEGTSVIYNPLPSLDCKSALAAVRLFGAETKEEDGKWEVTGHGRSFSTPNNYLDCGNSGSVMYFATPMAALADGYTFITGDEQIRSRPIMETLIAIQELGGEAFLSRPGEIYGPAIVRGAMKGGSAHFEGKLSQVVSGFMMAAPLLERDTDLYIRDPHEKPYFDITLDWMERYGIIVENNEDYTHFHIRGRQKYQSGSNVVASDWSSVAFPLVAGVISGKELTIEDVDFADSQGDKAVVDVLIQLGAHIIKDKEKKRLIVQGGYDLEGTHRIDLRDAPDALPALTVAAAYINGDTIFTGLEAVRLKETDRVKVMQEELEKLGVATDSDSTSMTVYGKGSVHGGEVDSHGDHRVAMALLVCGLATETPVTVKDAECAAVSFPNFFEVMSEAGACMEKIC